MSNIAQLLTIEEKRAILLKQKIRILEETIKHKDVIIDMQEKRIDLRDALLKAKDDVIATQKEYITCLEMAVNNG